jgi:hypothetical protein
LNNDEIEVACYALWAVKQWSVWDDAQERLWCRLQPIRTGDDGGPSTIELEPEGQVAVARALRCCAEQVEFDEDGQRLLTRLVGPHLTLADVLALVEQFEDGETIYAESTTPTARASVAVEPMFHAERGRGPVVPGGNRYGARGDRGLAGLTSAADALARGQIRGGHLLRRERLMAPSRLGKGRLTFPHAGPPRRDARATCVAQPISVRDGYPNRQIVRQPPHANQRPSAPPGLRATRAARRV